MAIQKKQQWASGKFKVVPATGSAPKRRRRRPRKPSAMTSVWAIISLLTLITLLITQGLLEGVVAGLSVIVTVISSINDAQNPQPVPTPRPVRPKASTPRGHGGSPGSPAKPSTGGKPRKRVCSARCRASTKPKSTCGCVCAGKTHGVGAGVP